LVVFQGDLMEIPISHVAGLRVPAEEDHRVINARQRSQLRNITRFMSLAVLQERRVCTHGAHAEDKCDPAETEPDSSGCHLQSSPRDCGSSGPQTGEYQPALQMAWETLRVVAHGSEPRPTRTGAAWNRDHLRTSIFAGTTCGTKAPAVSWPMASI